MLANPGSPGRLVSKRRECC